MYVPVFSLCSQQESSILREVVSRRISGLTIDAYRTTVHCNMQHGVCVCVHSHQGRAGTVLADVLHHSIIHILIQFTSSRRIISSHNTQQLPDLVLGLGPSVAEIEVYQLLNDATCD